MCNNESGKDQGGQLEDRDGHDDIEEDHIVDGDSEEDQIGDDNEDEGKYEGGVKYDDELEGELDNMYMEN